MNLAPFFADLNKLESLLGLPKGFVEGLLGEDDWSFIVKTHALIEAALTHVLVQANDPRLAKVLSHLQLGGGRTGKIAFARALEVLDEPSLKLIDQLSQLRNKLVHDVRELSFNLQIYLQSLSTGELNNLYRHIRDTLGVANTDLADEAGIAWLRQEPKLALAMSVFAVLGRILFRADPEEYARASTQAERVIPALALVLILVYAFASSDKSRDAAAGLKKTGDTNDDGPTWWQGPD